MLKIKAQGLTIGDLRTSPITEIMELFFKYQSEEREEVLNGYGRVLSLASEAEAVLIGTEYSQSCGYINRHITFQLFKNLDNYQEVLSGKYDNEMHPLEVLRITETEEGL